MNFYIDYLMSLITTENRHSKRLEKLLLHSIKISPTKRPKYFEGHHIVPKSWKPEWKKEKENIVNVSAKMHYVIHHLMYMLFPNDKYMARAFFLMQFKGTGCRISAREYEKLKS